MFKFNFTSYFKTLVFSCKKRFIKFFILFQARSEEHLAQEQAWLSSERIWLLHRGGFTPATRCGSADPDTGKLRVRLIPSGEELLVDEEDVEKVCVE